MLRARRQNRIQQETTSKQRLRQQRARQRRRLAVIETLENRRVLATFYAYDFSDNNDGVTFPYNELSLREAVIASNDNGANDTIYLKSGDYTLSLEGTLEDAAALGDLDVTEVGKRLTIIGQGTANTTIDADAIDRVFHILPGAELKLLNLTVTGGLATDAGYLVPPPSGDPEPAWGGGILNDGGTLTLQRADVIGNAAIAEPGLNALGGGIYVGGGAGPLNINQSVIGDNLAAAGDGFFGPGPEGYSSGHLGEGEPGNALGGGIYVGASSGSAHLERSLVVGNIAAGGSVDVPFFGSVSSYTAGHEDHGSARGGGIYVGGSVLTTNYTPIESNAAFGGFGGGAAEGGGVYHAGSSAAVDMVLRESPVVDNLARGGDGIPFFDEFVSEDSYLPAIFIGDGDGGDARGGGVYLYEGAMEVNKRSNVIGNRAVGGDGASTGFTIPENGGFTAGSGGQALGGGIYAAGAPATSADVSLNTSSVEGNEAAGGRGGNSEFDTAGRGGNASGGGIYVGAGSLDLEYMAPVSGNSATAGDGGSSELGEAGDGGDSRGGGIYAGGDGGSADVSASRSEVVGNQAVGGDAAGFLDVESFSIPIGALGADGGDASGGGIWVGVGSLSLSRSPVEGNQAVGGNGVLGGAGGMALGGGIYAGEGFGGVDVDLAFSDVTDNLAQGGNGGDDVDFGGDGGDAFGGGIYLGCFSTLAFDVYSDIEDNVAEGGAGGLGGISDGIDGDGFGDDVFDDPCGA